MVSSEKRKIDRKTFDLLMREAEFWSRSGRLDPQSLDSLPGLYEVTDRAASVTAALAAFAVLAISLGLLSLVAANWTVLPRGLRVGIIGGTYLSLMLASLTLSPRFPRSAEAARVLAAAAFGAGIFLISQMFQLEGDLEGALFLWFAGACVSAWLFADSQVLLLQVLALLFIGQRLPLLLLTGRTAPADPVLTAEGWGMALLLWALWRRLRDKGQGERFLSAVLHLNALFTLGLLADLSRILHPLLMRVLAGFLLGLVLVLAGNLKPGKRVLPAVRSWGLVLLGVFGLLLTLPPLYEDRSFLFAGRVLTPQAFSAAAAFVCALILLALLHRLRQSAWPKTFLCLLLLRYYFDLSLKFSSKSAALISFGLVLTGVVLWRKRKHRSRRDRSGQREGGETHGNR